MEEISNKLKEYNQEHLLQYIGQCEENAEKSALLADIESIDFAGLDKDIKTALSSMDSPHVIDESTLSAIPHCNRGSVISSSKEELLSHRRVGLEAIHANKVGVVLLAGGQGTRLGVSYPKGMHDIGLPSGKSLFQLQSERIRRLQTLSGGSGRICLYVMTSCHTHKETKSYFNENNYFGLSSEDVLFFEQKMIPCFDFQGKVILEKRSKIARSPNGNGGLYAALRNEKILDHMERREVEYVHVYCVDNVLVKVADPVFMGYCISTGVEAGNKVVKKVDPYEGVGVVCRLKGRYHVIEYSEISKETAELRDPATRDLLYNAGNICNHFFTLKFLQRICGSPGHLIRCLKQHVAKKKIPYFDGKETLTPSSSNGIKLEMFVFDVFEFTDRLGIWEVNREEEMSPVKNSIQSTNNNDKTAREDIYRLHKRYVKEAGGSFSECDGAFEISPLVSYDGEGLAGIVGGASLKCPVELK